MASVYASGLRPDQIDDLVENTLHHFEKDKFVDIALDLQRYFAWDNMLLRDRIGIDGGDQLQWQVKVRNTGSAKNTGMYAVDDVKVADVTKHALVPWTKQTANMAYDIDEPGFNSGDAVRIVNMLRLRRHDALSSFAELMEENFWGFPADTTDLEQLKPRGVPYWICRNASTATFGFNGTVPSTAYTDVAGISPTTYGNWANGTGRYTAISKRDCVRLLREATVKCNFRGPIPHSSPEGKTPRYVIPTTYEVIQRFEEMLEEQNTNLGNDVASKDGDVMFRRVPMVWVPFLDANHDTTGSATLDANPYGKNPIYGIDKASFRMVFKRGAYMRRSKPIIAPQQHSVRHIHWDSWANFQCFNRRSNFVITQSA